MSIIEYIGNDLKISIDDLIHEIKKLQEKLQEVKQKLDIKENS